MDAREPTVDTVLRARIGLRRAPELDRSEVEDRIAVAIRAAVAGSGAELRLLQVSLAAHPDWTWFGPADRASRDTFL